MSLRLALGALVAAFVLTASAGASAPPVGPLPSGPTQHITTTRGQLVAVALPHSSKGRVWRLARPVDPKVLRQVSEADVGSSVVVVYRADRPRQGDGGARPDAWRVRPRLRRPPVHRLGAVTELLSALFGTPHTVPGVRKRAVAVAGALAFFAFSGSRACGGPGDQLELVRIRRRRAGGRNGELQRRHRDLDSAEGDLHGRPPGLGRLLGRSRRQRGGIPGARAARHEPRLQRHEHDADVERLVGDRARGRRADQAHGAARATG